MRTEPSDSEPLIPPDAGPANQGAPGVFVLDSNPGPLHLVTDARIDSDDIVPKVGLAISAGVNVVQVRYPQLGARDLCTVVLAIQRETAMKNICVIVNDRLDVALATEAGGVHLGQRSLPVDVVRYLAGPDFFIGASVHTAEEAREAADGGVDYLTFGHVYPTKSHPGEEGLGTTRLIEIVKAVEPLPVIAIGGITPERVPEVLDAGAAGVAAMRAILGSSDVARTTSDFIKALRHDPVSTNEET